jgi:hypothetical protein
VNLRERGAYYAQMIADRADVMEEADGDPEQIAAAREVALLLIELVEQALIDEMYAQMMGERARLAEDEAARLRERLSPGG